MLKVEAEANVAVTFVTLKSKKKMLRVSTKQHQKGKLRLNAASSLLYDHFIFA